MNLKHCVRAHGDRLAVLGLLTAMACHDHPAAQVDAAVGVVPPPVLLSNAAGATQKPKSAAALLPCPAHVPEALNPPARATLELALPADGVQVYVCSSTKAEAPAWTLEGPHAVLRSGSEVAAIHFAGPMWQGLDGSSVKGTKLESANAPKAGAVPWLLLSAAPVGEGAFAHVTHIQRLDTVGGTAPSTGCDAAHVGAKVLVPYQAGYYFYRTANAGEAVVQCRSDRGKAHVG